MMTEPTTEKAWAELPALIDFAGGYDLWDVERLVRFAGSQKAGLRIVERVEQQLAENNIGHLPTKLPTDGTCKVLLYNKDQPNLGYVLSLVHELATQDVNDNTNGSIHQLKSLLDGIMSFRPTAQRDAVARHAPQSKAL
ncbi:hypothetical protein [Streptomyces sp. NBC_01465]|uniref:hypothetical protein n=1 Tax=Streptomyces sp. NBC_01465 TaxID=2903878 RepID=UPI002E37F1EB|nr:hypothetical protein [Streptomyces sp. NBC_01465]